MNLVEVPVAYTTYVQFAKKYNIKVTTPSNERRSFASLRKAIKAYEKKHNISGGMYQ